MSETRCCCRKVWRSSSIFLENSKLIITPLKCSTDANKVYYCVMLLAIKLAMMMDELSNNVAAMTSVNQDEQFTMDVCIYNII